MTRAQLLARLEAAGVALNDHARALFASERFTTSTAPRTVTTLELSVRELGCPGGAALPEILRRAAARGLAPAPLELAPHLRLQFLDQPEGALGHPATKGCAPPGSITVISERVGPDDFPAGFYLRRIEGTLWLRGYRADDEHLWAPEDRLIFAGSR